MALNSTAMQPQLTPPHFSFTASNCLIFCSTGKQANHKKREAAEIWNEAMLSANKYKHMFNTDARPTLREEHVRELEAGVWPISFMI